MITYLLQVTICWGLFLGLYHLALRKETFFMVNRAYLLLTIILGLIIPRMTWDTSMFMEQPTIEMAVGYMSYSMDQFSAILSIEDAPTPWTTWTIIYALGVLLMMSKLLYGIGKIMWMRHRADIIMDGDQTIAYTSGDHAPFTFFGTIYLSRDRNDEDRDPEILTHEQAHVSGLHTLDVLFVEVVKAFFWFNPLVYSYDHAIKTIHEYIADANVLQRTALQRYGRLLLRQAQPGLEIALANHFYNTQLKKRFKMMTRTPSQKRMLLKYLSVLPFILVVSLVFTNQKVQAEISKVEEMDLAGMFNSESKALQAFHKQMELAEVTFRNSTGSRKDQLSTVCEIINNATLDLTEADRNGIGQIELVKDNYNSISIFYNNDDQSRQYFTLEHHAVNYIPIRFSYDNHNQLCSLIEGTSETRNGMPHVKTNKKNNKEYQKLLSEIESSFSLSERTVQDALSKICESANKLNKLYKSSPIGSFTGTGFPNQSITGWLQIEAPENDNNPNFRKDLLITINMEMNDPIMVSGSRFSDCSLYDTPALTQSDYEQYTFPTIRKVLDDHLAKRSELGDGNTSKLIFNEYLKHLYKTTDQGSFKELYSDWCITNGMEATFKGLKLTHISFHVPSDTKRTNNYINFKIDITKSGDKIYLDCVEGCDWERLTLHASITKNKLISYYGIVSPIRDLAKGNDRNKKTIHDQEAKKHHKYFFHLSYNNNGITLQGIHGVTWQALSGSLMNESKASLDNSGIRVSGGSTAASVDSVPTSSEIFKVAEVKPEFPGGQEALYKYIFSHLKYPEAARKAGVQGNTVTRFVVEKDGSISNIELIRDIEGGVGEEALRVVSIMAKEKTWIPGTQGGKALRAEFNLPIRFKLEGNSKSTTTPLSTKDETNLLNEEVFKVVEVKPEFPGGQEALYKYIFSHLKYPEAARKAGVQGNVVIGFVIEKDGSISNIEMRRDPGAGTGDEAMRVISIMSDEITWIPGKQSGKEVRVQYNIPIRFKLEGGEKASNITAPPPPPPTNIQMQEAKKREPLDYYVRDTVIQFDAETFEEKITVTKTLISGSNDILQNIDQYPFVDNMCDYSNGYTPALRKCADEELIKWVHQNTTYPAEARKNGIDGTVILQFVVEKDGTISTPELVKEIGYGTSEVVLDLFQKLKQDKHWHPGRHNDKVVRAKMILPIKFKVENEGSTSSRTTSSKTENHNDKLSPYIVLLNDDGQAVYTLQDAHLEMINKEDIKHLSVLKGENATDKYGSQGENGVIEIQLEAGKINIPTELESKQTSKKSEMSFGSLNIYPNPVSQMLTIEINGIEVATQLILSSMDGKVMHQEDLMDSASADVFKELGDKVSGTSIKVTHQMADYPRGVYIVSIIEGNKVYAQPIVKH